MTQPARFSGTARRELAKVLRDMEHAAAAQRLRDAVESAARRLADARYRFWSVVGFPYLIVYRPDLSPPSIVRFVHTARDLPKALAELGS